MPAIEIIIRDDDGNIIDSRNARKYRLDLGKQSFHEREGAVEKFKRQALPDREAGLLEAAQNAFILDKKKT